MHGIQRSRDLGAPFPPNTVIRKITIRYMDGRTVNFYPEAEREFFSDDDIKNLTHVVEHASGVAEWADVSGERESRH